jgi:hypothetical protein
MKIPTITTRNTLPLEPARGGGRRWSGVERIGVVILLCGLLAWAGVGGAMWQRRVAAEEKLHFDIAVMNAAVRSFLESGGHFPAGVTDQEVIERMKQRQWKLEAISEVRRGTVLDERVFAAPSSERPVPKARWSGALNRFIFTTEDGPGTAEFMLVAPSARLVAAL